MNTLGALFALAMLVALAGWLLTFGRSGEPPNVSSATDIEEILRLWRSTRTTGERVIVIAWYARRLARAGFYGASIATVSAIAIAIAQVFGGGWEIARQMLDMVLGFLSRLRETRPHDSCMTCG